MATKITTKRKKLSPEELEKKVMRSLHFLIPGRGGIEKNLELFGTTQQDTLVFAVVSCLLRGLHVECTYGEAKDILKKIKAERTKKK